MKKTKTVLSLLLALCLALSLFACAAPENKDDAAAEPDPTAAPTAAVTSEPTEAPALSFTAGSYTAVGRGNNGDISVTVNFSDTAITDITVNEHKETAGVSDVAFERLPGSIIQHQSLAVDTVSGATHTSEGILTAVEACVVLAGGDVSAMKIPLPKAELPEIGPGDETVDVVVVGGGVAGLRSALLAAEAGKSVALLEKLPYVGGNALISAGIIQAAGTSVQVAFGIEGDTPEKFMDFLRNPDSEYATDNPVLTTIMHKGAQQAVEDLVGRGLEFVGFNASSDRMHVIYPEMRKGGPTLINLLSSECEKAGVKVYLETAGTELLTENDAVCGVRASGVDGEKVFYAKSVILTTGGFASGKEMVTQYFPDLEWIRSNAGAGATGDGIRMAQAIGADVRAMTSGIQMGTASQRSNAPVGVTMNFAAAILVNGKGDRFIPESMNYGLAAGEMAQLTGSTFYLVFDDIILEKTPQLVGLVEKDSAVDAATIEELAKLIGADNLPKTLAHYNEMAAAGSDTDFGRSVHLEPITGSHFYAIEIYPYVYNTYGGLAIDTGAHVLDTSGKPIKNLYAAGEVTGSPEVQEGFFYTSGVAQGLAFAKVAVKSIVSEQN